MSSIKKGLKENKYTAIVFFIFLGTFIIGWLFYGMVIPQTGKPLYGHRLDDLKGLEVTKQDSSNIVTALEKEDNIVSAKVDVKGKIINVIYTVTEKTKVKQAKTYTVDITSALSSKQLEKYDIQVFIKNEKEKQEDYPVLGYKNSTSKTFAY